MTELRGSAIVLAAGRGTRMRSSLAKVLHPLLGRPMVAWPARAATAAGLDVCVVVHHQESDVRAALSNTGVRFARQETPRGTGDAVASALSVLPATGTAVVMAGDAPLLRAETLSRLLDAHRDHAVTVLTAHVDEPASYGRLVRDGNGLPCAIVEASECTPAQLQITEINTGLYAFDVAWLRETLPHLPVHEPKGEVYLTDALALAAAQGRAQAVVHGDAGETLGVNDKWALAEARSSLQRRILRDHAMAGVTFEDPARTVVEADVLFGEDVVVGPGVVIRSGCSIGDRVVIDPYCVLSNAHISADARLHSHSVVDGAAVGERAQVGPLARLRPGAKLGEGSKVGNFCEVKKSTLGPGAKVNHLSYIGDATIGAGSNVGAGTITCNYDGFAKHRTVVGAGAFIGSNTALVAPVVVGAGALIGAGSVVVEDVPDDALAVARGRQRTVAGGGAKFRADRRGDA